MAVPTSYDHSAVAYKGDSCSIGLILSLDRDCVSLTYLPKRPIESPLVFYRMGHIRKCNALPRSITGMSSAGLTSRHSNLLSFTLVSLLGLTIEEDKDRKGRAIRVTSTLVPVRKSSASHPSDRFLLTPYCMLSISRFEEDGEYAMSYSL